MSEKHSTAERNVGAAVLILLILGCLLVMRPFVSALLWALVLCCASWPLYMRLLRYVGQRRTLAAMFMCLAMVLLLLMPFFIVGMTLADNVKDVTAAVRGWIAQGPPQAPQWLGKIPVVGQRATEQWNVLAADTAKFWTGAQRFIEPVSSWLLRVGLALMSGVVELALSIFIAFFFFRD